MNTPQIQIEKHISPDNPQGNTEYYVITVPGFLEQPIYGSIDLQKVEDRFKHIQEIGYVAYLQEIQITKEVLKAEDFNYPELIEAVEEHNRKKEADLTIGDEGEIIEEIENE